MSASDQEISSIAPVDVAETESEAIESQETAVSPELRSRVTEIFSSRPIRDTTGPDAASNIYLLTHPKTELVGQPPELSNEQVVEQVKNGLAALFFSDQFREAGGIAEVFEAINPRLKEGPDGNTVVQEMREAHRVKALEADVEVQKARKASSRWARISKSLREAASALEDLPEDDEDSGSGFSLKTLISRPILARVDAKYRSAKEFLTTAEAKVLDEVENPDSASYFDAKAAYDRLLSQHSEFLTQPLIMSRDITTGELLDDPIVHPDGMTVLDVFSACSTLNGAFKPPSGIREFVGFFGAVDARTEKAMKDQLAEVAVPNSVAYGARDTGWVLQSMVEVNPYQEISDAYTVGETLAGRMTDDEGVPIRKAQKTLLEQYQEAVMLGDTVARDRIRAQIMDS